MNSDQWDEWLSMHGCEEELPRHSYQPSSQDLAFWTLIASQDVKSIKRWDALGEMASVELRLRANAELYRMDEDDGA